jgi:hypothetical protein
MNTTKRFRGKIYTLLTWAKTKPAAQRLADKARRDTWKAIVSPVDGGYGVFVRN